MISDDLKIGGMETEMKQRLDHVLWISIPLNADMSAGGRLKISTPK